MYYYAAYTASQSRKGKKRQRSRQPKEVTTTDLQTTDLNGQEWCKEEFEVLKDEETTLQLIRHTDSTT